MTAYCLIVSYSEMIYKSIFFMKADIFSSLVFAVLWQPKEVSKCSLKGKYSFFFYG